MIDKNTIQASTHKVRHRIPPCELKELIQEAETFTGKDLPQEEAPASHFNSKRTIQGDKGNLHGGSNANLHTTTTGTHYLTDKSGSSSESSEDEPPTVINIVLRD